MEGEILPSSGFSTVGTTGSPIITLKSTFEINNAVLIMDEKCSTSHRKSANIAYYQIQVRIYKSNGIWQSTSPRFTRIQPIRINEKPTCKVGASHRVILMYDVK